MSDTTDPITHPFDQTNGVLDGLDDESGRSASADPDASTTSTPERTDAAGDGPGRHVAAVAVDRQHGAVDEADRTGSSAAADGGPAAPVGAPDRDASPAADSVAHVFDQTNGVVEGLEGEADGSAAGDDDSAADRGGLHEPNPVGQQDAWHDDHYGTRDGRDPNP